MESLSLLRVTRSISECVIKKLKERKEDGCTETLLNTFIAENIELATLQAGDRSNPMLAIAFARLHHCHNYDVAAQPVPEPAFPVFQNDVEIMAGLSAPSSPFTLENGLFDFDALHLQNVGSSRDPPNPLLLVDLRPEATVGTVLTIRKGSDIRREQEREERERQVTTITDPSEGQMLFDTMFDILDNLATEDDDLATEDEPHNMFTPAVHQEGD